VRSPIKGQRNVGTRTALAHPDINARGYLQDMFHTHTEYARLVTIVVLCFKRYCQILLSRKLQKYLLLTICGEMFV